MQERDTLQRRCAWLFLAIASSLAVVPTQVGAEVKKTIAVAPLEYAQQAATKSWFSGEALHAQLITELNNSGRYRVVERENIQGILGEQDLGTAGRTRKGSGPATGDLEGAQLMIKCVITDAEEESAKSGRAGYSGSFGIGGGGGKTKYRVTMDVRIYDTQTSLIMDTATVTALQEKKEGGGGLNVKGFSLGGKGKKQDTTGAIVRELIQKALAAIDQQAQVLGWKSTVIKATSDKFIILGGQRDGLEEGMTFEVFELGEQLVDEETGEVLDEGEETKIGEITLTRVKDKVSYAKKSSGEDPAEGNVVRLMEEK